jgi:ABC-type transport system substrate-binding protein
MRRAGWPFDEATRRGGYPRTLSYLANADSFDAAAAQLVQQQLARIGVRIELRLVSFPTFLALTGRPGHVALGSAAWSADFLDPSDFFEPTLSTAAIQEEESQNASFFSSPELDALLARGRATTDERARSAIYRRAEEIVRDEAPWAIGYDFRYWQVSQPWLHGFAGGAQGMDVRRARIERATPALRPAPLVAPSVMPEAP